MNRIAFVAIGLMGLAGAGLAVADVTKEETMSFEINADGRFSLDNVNGDVVIAGGAGDSIEVTAIKRADSEKDLQQIEILIDADVDRVSIETKYEKEDRWFGWGDSSGSVEYRVSVPATIALDTIETVNGNLEIEGMDGKIKAATVNGDIEILGIVGDVNLDTVNGSIEAQFSRLEGRQRAILDTVNGRIEVTLPANADASVSADTVNGSIRGGDFGLEVDKSGFVGKEMQGDIGSGSARLKMDTVNGAIRLNKD